MSNMNKKDHDFLYPLVKEQQGGEFCVNCDRDKKQLMNDGHKPEFCIDVYDNSNNHSRKNLRSMQLLCHSCNTKKNHPTLEEPLERKPTPEMIKGRLDEHNFRRWVLGHYMTNENIGLTFDYLINSGSETVGNSPESCKRYLGKMTSEVGMYTWEDRFRVVLMVLKSKYKNN